MDVKDIKKGRKAPVDCGGRLRLSKYAYAALAMAGLALLLRAFYPSQEDGLALGARAPEFHAADLSGRTVSLSEFRGKVVLLDFWATWCRSCLEEIPTLKQLHTRLSLQGLELLAASVDEHGPQTVADFAAQEHLPYRVLFADPSFARAYHVWGLPKKYLIDQEGFLYRKYIGDMDAKGLEADVQKLLNTRRAS